MRDHIVFVDTSGNVQLLQQPVEIDDGGGSVGLGNEGGGGSSGGGVIEPILKVKPSTTPFEPSPCPAKHIRAVDGTCQPIEPIEFTPVLLPNGNTDFLGTVKQFATDNPMIALAIAGLVVYSVIKS